MKKVLNVSGFKKTLFLSAAMAIITVFSFTVCKNPATGTEESNEPVSVSILPAAPTVAQGGQQLFYASVSPARASQDVTWSVIPSNAGVITEEGLLTVSVLSTTVGNTFIVKAAATGTNISGTATVTVGPPVTPTNISVTPANIYLTQGKQQQFSAAVGPAGAPQEVTWSISPTGAGTITSGGLLTVTGATTGDTLTVTATAANHPSVSGSTTVKVPEPITITITGIPSQFNGEYGRIILCDPLTGNWLANGSTWISGTSATFQMHNEYSGGSFASPGDYEVQLRFDSAWYHIPIIGIPEGSSTIHFSTFTTIPTINIVIEGIPAEYNNDSLGISFKYASGSMGTSAKVINSTITYLLDSSYVGNITILLRFGDWENGDIYRLDRNFNTGTHYIQFSTFTYVPPINITVTGIPSEYNGLYYDVDLLNPGTLNRIGNGWGQTTGSSTTFTLRGVFPGTYDIVIYLYDKDDMRALYRASSRTINPGTNTIPFNQFTLVPPLYIIVTGIPSRFHGDWGWLVLNTPGTWDESGWGEELISGSSVTFKVWMLNNIQGTYDVYLHLHANDECEEFIIPSRYITDGAVIPWSDFLPYIYSGTIMASKSELSSLVINPEPSKNEASGKYGRSILRTR